MNFDRWTPMNAFVSRRIRQKSRIRMALMSRWEVEKFRTLAWNSGFILDSDETELRKAINIHNSFLQDGKIPPWRKKMCTW